MSPRALIVSCKDAYSKMDQCVALRATTIVIVEHVVGRVADHIGGFYIYMIAAILLPTMQRSTVLCGRVGRAED